MAAEPGLSLGSRLTIFTTWCEDSAVTATAPPLGRSQGSPAEPSRIASRRRSRWRGYGLFALFAFPNLILIAVFAYVPVLGNVYLSLTRWDMISPEPTFVWLENYTDLFTDPNFGRVITITVIWVLTMVLGCGALGLAFAVLFSTRLRGSGVVTTVAFAPHVLSGAAIAAVWLFIFDPNYGLSRAAFELVGATSPAWTTSTTWALPALLIVSVWKSVGFVALIYLAALQGIPHEVREAALLDGAGPWRGFWHVIFPLLSPTTFFVTVTTIISAFQSFDVIAMMTGGGPGGATTTLSWFIYDQGFRNFDAGYAAAGGMVMFLILLVVTAVQLRFVERRVHY